MNKKLILTICLIGLLLISPASAEIVTAKVDDKGVLYANRELVGTLHTPYGWITVSDDDYNKIRVNDTIRYDTKLDPFWFTWSVEVV